MSGDHTPDPDPPARPAASGPRRRTPAADTATIAIAAGSSVNGLAALLFQVVGTRSLGAEAYAPIGVLWTLQYLWIAVAVTAVEAYVTRLVTIGGAADAQLARFLRLFRRWLVGAAAATAAVGVALAGPLFEGVRGLGLVLGAVVLGYGWYGVVRGRAAGVGRFRAYALATAGESVVRLVAAVAVLAVVTSTLGLAWTFPLGPIAVVAWAWLRRHPAGREVPDAAPATEALLPAGRGRRFLAAASTANVSVQFLLAGGPLVLLPLGADPASVAVFFTTITAARVPMTFALNGGLSRVLPPLTRLAEAGDWVGLRRATLRMLAGIAVTSAVAAAGAAVLGPEMIALVFGEDFRPERGFTVVVAIGTVLAVGGLLLDQVLIAAGREQRLPAVWLGAVALAGVLVTTLPGGPTIRVAVGFALATGAAVTALSIPLIRPTR